MAAPFFTIPRVGAEAASPLAAQSLPTMPAPPTPLGESAGPTFQQTLTSFLGQVDNSQKQADALVEAFALGEPVEVHRVIMALGEAQTALDLTVQVRNKVLEAYQEVMRTQI